MFEFLNVDLHCVSHPIDNVEMSKDKDCSMDKKPAAVMDFSMFQKESYGMEYSIQEMKPTDMECFMY